MDYVGPLPIWALVVIIVSGFLVLMTGILLCIFIYRNKNSSKSSSSSASPPPTRSLSPPKVPLRDATGSLPLHLRDVANDQIYANLNFEPIA